MRELHYIRFVKIGEKNIKQMIRISKMGKATPKWQDYE